MYCPQCGQQQVSNETRFCSRCGFPLAAVAEVLARGGLLPTPEFGPADIKPSPRRRGVRQGMALIMLGAVLVPMLAVFSNYTGGSVNRFFEILTALAAIIFFIGGFARILFAALLEESSKALKPAPAIYASAQLNAMPTAARPASLPPQQSTPVTDYRAPRWNTAEILRTPSVTEGTTKLLDKDAETPFGNKRED